MSSNMQREHNCNASAENDEMHVETLLLTAAAVATAATPCSTARGLRRPAEDPCRVQTMA